MTNVPKASKTSISKLKSSKKTIALNWNKKNVDGYKIYIKCLTMDYIQQTRKNL